MYKFPTIRWTTSLFVVVISQLLAVAAGIFSILTLATVGVGYFAQLPPISFVYTAVEVSWLGDGRIAAYVVIALSDVILGITSIWYGLSRDIKVIKYITIAIGIQFISSSAVYVTLAGVISVGGWTHLASFAAALIQVVVVTATAGIMVVLHPNLRMLGKLNDQFFEHHISSEDDNNA